ncbi:helix-turn-helix transcriptional regulator [Staphylococcus equorum]
MKAFYQVEFNGPNKLTVSINDGLRLVLVLSSRLTVWKYNEIYEYQKGDIFIINHREQFRFIENKDTLYISIHLTESYLKQYIDDYNNKILILDKGCLQEVIYKQIVNAIAMIGIVDIRKGEFYRLHIEKQLINLMFIIARFLPTKMNKSYKAMLNDYRVEFVCDYIQSNHSNDISLTKVAKKVALSTAYLSKIFTQQIGVGFNQYLIHIRLEHCKEDLIYTDNTITQIALKNGFSNSNILLKHFKKDTQMTPTQYREKYKNTHLHENLNEENEKVAYQIYLHYLSDYINQSVSSVIQSPEAEKVIDVTLKESKQTLLHYQHVIQIGNLDVLLIQRYRKQILEAKKCIGLNHVLIKDPVREGFIKDKIIESDEVIPNVHRYMKIDECLDFLLMYHIGLGIEINPPKAMSKFKTYYKELAYALEHIYNTVPDSHLFNLVLYINCKDDHNSQTIITLFKQYFKNIKIVLNFNIENQGEVRIAKHILEAHNQYIDSIAFCANQNDIINFQSIESDQYNLAKKHITLKLKKIKEWLDVKDRKISFTLLNWNTLTGNTSLTNGKYFRAGIIFEQLIEMNGHINIIG